MQAKRITNYQNGRIKHRGAILLIMLVILVIGIAAILVNSATSSKIMNLRQANTTAALAQAKAALIGYAITYGDTHNSPPQVHGYLPCPDSDASNGEGSSKSTCGSQDVSVIGRLPWRTLDLPALRDGNGECLWYAISGTYKDNPKTGLMNWDTYGQFQVYTADGTLLASQVVAVIIAPGAPQSGQNRSDPSSPPVAPICGGNYTAGNYLDSDGTINNATVSSTALATSTFRFGTVSGINDQMAVITMNDIWIAIQKRSDFQNRLHQLTQKVTQCLAFYGNSNYSCGSYCTNRSLPWPARVSLGTNQLSDYYDNANYNDSSNTGPPYYNTLYAGRVPYNVGTSAGSHNPLTTLMNSTSCGPMPGGWTTSDDAWYNNWKDHLFYGLAADYVPTSGGGQSCGYCLSINGAGHYAGVVIFAGKKLAGQARTDKTAVSDYLEGNNDNRILSPSGTANYSAGASSTFNDVVCYISQFLNVTCL